MKGRRASPFGVVVLALAWILAAAAPATAGEIGFMPPVQPPEAGVEPHVGRRLPLDLPFTDSRGERAPLSRFFSGDRPVLLVFGYYRCPQLCGLLMHGLLSGLHDSGLPASAYRIVRVSIDPQDTPRTAAARRSADLRYAALLCGNDARAMPDLELLTGEPLAIHHLADGIGWRYSSLAPEPSDPDARFAHPATAVVVTPDGRVAHYLDGLQFDPRALRAAIQDASSGHVDGGVIHAIALLCAHFDPRLGRHSAVVMASTRLVGLLLVLALAVWWWWSQRHMSDGSRGG